MPIKKGLSIIFLCLFTHLNKGYSSNIKIGEPNTRNPDRTIFFEALGNGIFYSLNYEERPWIKGNWQLGYRAGLCLGPSFIASKLNENPFFSVPVEFVAMKGRSNNFLSLGLGLTYFQRKQQNGFPHLWNFIGVGYKYIPKNGSLYLKIQPLLAIPIYRGTTEFFFENLNYTIGLGVGFNFTSKRYKGQCD